MENKNAWKGTTPHTRVHTSTDGRDYIIVDGETRYLTDKKGKSYKTYRRI